MLKQFVVLSQSLKLKIVGLLFVFMTLIYLVVRNAHPGFYILPLYLTAIGFPWKKGWVAVPIAIILGFVKDYYFGLVPLHDIFKEYVAVSCVFSVVYLLGAQLKIAFDKLTRVNDKLVMLYHREKENANMDYLTGLGNRRFFQLALDREIDIAQQTDPGLGLIIIDIDNFKQINDNYGHQVGDEVLKNVSNIIKKLTRGIDISCRYGGEEFAVILPGADYSVIRDVAERIRSSIANSQLFIDKKVIKVTISAGVSCYPQDALTEEKLVKTADERLYFAKKDGKNQVA